MLSRDTDKENVSLKYLQKYLSNTGPGHTAGACCGWLVWRKLAKALCKTWKHGQLINRNRLINIMSAPAPVLRQVVPGVKINMSTFSACHNHGPWLGRIMTGRAKHKQQQHAKFEFNSPTYLQTWALLNCTLLFFVFSSFLFRDLFWCFGSKLLEVA